MSSKALVAEGADRTILGALTLKTASLCGRKIGILDWAVVDPSSQGKGVGKALLGQGLAYFHRENCADVVTTDVDGYNSASWNTCYAHGLRYWPVSQQIRKFGWCWLRLLAKIPHIGPGAFILHLPHKAERQAEESEANDVWTFIGVTLLIGFFLLPLSRSREVLWESTNLSAVLAPLRPATLLAGAGVVAAYLGARMAAQRLAARALHLPVTFRPWDTGIMMAALLAAAFSAFIPAFGGNVYAREPGFRYDRARPVMGKITVAGVAVSLAMFTLFTLCAETGTGIPREVAEVGRYVGFAFGLTDTLFFFAPFQAVAAGHLWLWHRAVWFVALAAFLSVWLILPRLV